MRRRCFCFWLFAGFIKPVSPTEKKIQINNMKRKKKTTNNSRSSASRTHTEADREVYLCERVYETQTSNSNNNNDHQRSYLTNSRCEPRPETRTHPRRRYIYIYIPDIHICTSSLHNTYIYLFIYEQAGSFRGEET